MNFTLHQLQIFTKIVEKQSITKTAEEMHLTQPAVSVQLKNFQEQFDMPLTEVVGRKLYITDFGMEIAEIARTILDQVDEINYKLMAYQGNTIGKLKVSVVSTGKYVMPYFLTDFLHKHPGVDIAMDVTNKSKVLESLHKNDVDFALVSILPENLQFEQLELLPNKLFLVGSEEDAKNLELKTNDLLHDLTMIYREDGSGTRLTMEKFLKEKIGKHLKRIELTSNEAVKQAVLAGIGFSIMPLIGIRNELQNGSLRIIPYSQLPIQTNWSLIWLKNKKHSIAASAYLDYLQTHRDEIIQKHFSWCDQY